MDGEHDAERKWDDDRHPVRRRRKLLLHKQQILKIHRKVRDGGYTIVPLQIYFSDGHAKVEIAVAKGKREHDRRRAEWDREDSIAAARAVTTHRTTGR